MRVIVEAGISQIQKNVELDECVLCLQLREKLGRLTTKNSLYITSLFQSIFPETNTDEVVGLMASAIDTAKRGQRWEGNRESDGLVGIGFYTSDMAFYSLLLHEVAHNVLTALDRKYCPKSLVKSDRPWEEEFCWQFSELLCQLLSLPYALDVALAAVRLAEIIKVLTSTDDSSHLLFTDAAGQEKFVTGFASELGEHFIWTEDGVPVLASPHQK